MNKRIQELRKQAMEPSGVEGLGGPYMELNEEKFAELIVQELVSKMEVEGSEFYHNEPNDYGAITVQFFVPGDPHQMCGEEIQGRFRDGVKGTGRYRLNQKFVEYLVSQLS